MTMRWVEEKLGVKLDYHFKLPKMRYKGVMVQPQTVRSER
jgi:PIH1 N-terminal domain